MHLKHYVLRAANRCGQCAQKWRWLRARAGVVTWEQRVASSLLSQPLVGKQLEVLWKYTNMDTGEKQLIWSTGRVARVADGLTDQRSSRAKKILPAGAVLWAWDADPDFGEQAGEQWLMLLPKKWNPHKQAQLYSWRYDPREFGAARAAPERPQNVRRDADACA